MRDRTDAAFMALAEWINEQQRLVERTFEARAGAACGAQAAGFAAAVLEGWLLCLHK